MRSQSELDIIEQLAAFNSKERFYLLGYILGNRSFSPSSEFLSQLEEALGISFPDALFCAMDYHLDWIYAALCKTYQPQSLYNNNHGEVKGQQEDVDFLIAFERNRHVHLICIEAKGVTGWSNAQTISKADRLRTIFGAIGKNWLNVTPYFVLMSPTRPQKLTIAPLLGWATSPPSGYHWIELSIPKTLQKVTRCDSLGQANQDGGYWCVTKRQ
ncbi:hypothetical protein NI389_15640 [Pseudoalteromonas xiamenensis]|uniref:hypothetical protein n=1 Tax=Pseudoalteromonas xiamenensis TaxID=882626 RepID=UPI0027E49668|nr:hypothetical protein [Pseudoalteromonas xiamenensis]WMN59590.1 hypothetical protein NI389_15640 [Pseudoalteromonas xiamenensis]